MPNNPSPTTLSLLQQQQQQQQQFLQIINLAANNNPSPNQLQMNPQQHVSLQNLNQSPTTPNSSSTSGSQTPQSTGNGSPANGLSPSLIFNTSSSISNNNTNGAGGGSGSGNSMQTTPWFLNQNNNINNNNSGNNNGNNNNQQRSNSLGSSSHVNESSSFGNKKLIMNNNNNLLLNHGGQLIHQGNSSPSTPLNNKSILQSMITPPSTSSSPSSTNNNTTPPSANFIPPGYVPLNSVSNQQIVGAQPQQQQRNISMQNQQVGNPLVEKLRQLLQLMRIREEDPNHPMFKTVSHQMITNQIMQIVQQIGGDGTAFGVDMFLNSLKSQQQQINVNNNNNNRNNNVMQSVQPQTVGHLSQQAQQMQHNIYKQTQQQALISQQFSPMISTTTSISSSSVGSNNTQQVDTMMLDNDMDFEIFKSTILGNDNTVFPLKLDFSDLVDFKK